MLLPVVGVRISEYLHEFVGRLFTAEYAVREISVFVLIDNNMLRLRYQAMLKSAYPAKGVLVCSVIERSDVKRFFLAEFGHVYGVDVLFGIVIIVRVARKPAH